jgi:hypothetical protein
MRRTRSGSGVGVEKRAKMVYSIDEMETGVYWTRQCDDVSAGVPGVRLMTSSDWIETYDVKGKNGELFLGFQALYRRFNKEGLGKDKAEIPGIEDIATCPILCKQHRHGFYDGVALMFLLVQENEGTRQIKSTTRAILKNVKAGWPLAFALVFRLWPRSNIPELTVAQSIWKSNDKELQQEKDFLGNPDCMQKMMERQGLKSQAMYVQYMQEERRFSLTYLNHLAADANFGGFGKMLINMLKAVFSDTVVCLEISIDDSDMYSVSRQRGILKLMSFYEHLGFISVSDLREGSLLRDFFIKAYLCAWMRIKPSDLEMRNILDSNPINGKWMVLAPERPGAEQLGLYVAAKRGQLEHI